jgi:hypothetical protein
MKNIKITGIAIFYTDFYELERRIFFIIVDF